MVNNNLSSSKINDTLIISPDSPWKPHLEGLSSRQQMIFSILRGNPPSFKEIAQDQDLLRSVIVKKQPHVMKEARELIQKAFDDMIAQFEKGPALSESDRFHLEVIIGDLLDLFPFLSPQESETLRVPVYIAGQWKKIDYNIEKICLTHSWMGSPITAYGLTAKDAPPVLLFKGSTYPADEGFSLSIITDLNPFARVGDYVFRIGKEKISAWLEKSTQGGNKAILIGKSLGGIQAAASAITFSDKVEKVMAYCPPGFSPLDLKQIYSLHDNNLLPQIQIYFQKDDLVHYTDWVAEKGIEYYEVSSPKEPRGLRSHVEFLSAHEHSKITKWDPVNGDDKVKRVALSILRALLSCIMFPLVVTFHAILTLIKRLIHEIMKIHRKIQADKD